MKRSHGETDGSDASWRNGLLKEALSGRYGTGRGRPSNKGRTGSCNPAKAQRPSREGLHTPRVT
ncbi:MAG: hypothetical protein KBE04_13755 [Phycisphaerae bacterium]|nr:hypothetical protein [Phycisphaerae bacterium]